MGAITIPICYIDITQGSEVLNPQCLFKPLAPLHLDGPVELCIVASEVIGLALAQDELLRTAL